MENEQQAAPAPQGVVEGRVIHYVPSEHEYRTPRNENRHVPGVITRVWNAQTGYVNATIFPDGSNDGLVDEGMALWRTSIQYDESGKPGTWHYPERA